MSGVQVAEEGNRRKGAMNAAEIRMCTHHTARMSDCDQAEGMRARLERSKRATQHSYHTKKELVYILLQIKLRVRCSMRHALTQFASPQTMFHVSASLKRTTHN